MTNLAAFLMSRAGIRGFTLTRIQRQVNRAKCLDSHFVFFSFVNLRLKVAIFPAH
jgi:hypothetical protein